MAPKDSCLTRSRRKTASATIYLMEELGDARLRCDQLLRYLNEAVELINKSTHKDHFFEVAGHLINEVPQTAFKLQKALEAVALAADRIDYEEIKQGLRPEKVEELERVLKDVRIRQVHHRSLGDEMTPKQAASKLRNIVKTARAEGTIPTAELAQLIRALDPSTSKVASATTPLEDRLEKLAAVLEAPAKEGAKHSKVKLAAVLRSLTVEAEMQNLSKVAFAPTDEAIGGLFEQIKGFAVASARAANVHRWRPALLNLYYIVDNIGTIMVRLGSMDTAKSEGLKREIRQMLPQAAKAIEESSSYSIMASGKEAAEADISKLYHEMSAHLDTFDMSWGMYERNPEKNKSKLADALRYVKALRSVADIVIRNLEAKTKTARHEEGKPADPTKDMSPEDAAKWKEMTEEHGDNFKAACEGEDGKLSCGEDPKMSKFEEGKPADPTEQMSEEDAKKWRIENLKNKDNFKEAAEGSWSETFEDNWAMKVKTDEGEYTFTLRPFEGPGQTLYRLTVMTPNKRLLKHKRQLPDKKKMKEIGKAFAQGLKTPSGGVDFTQEWTKMACDMPMSSEDEAKRSRFEQGKPADPTKMMDPADAQAWKDNTEEHKDNFKEKDSYDFSGGF